MYIEIHSIIHESNYAIEYDLNNISPQTHEDYRGLERAKEAMVDVANYINEMKRDSEHLELIQKVRVSSSEVRL